jgi:site-specific DNA-methyltransferase (adenine-specific)
LAQKILFGEEIIIVSSFHHEILAEGVEIFHADCFDILPQILADHIITDPPYESHMHLNKANASGIRLDGYASPKPLEFDSIDKIRPLVTPLMVNACKGWMLVFCTPEGVCLWRDEIEKTDAKYKRACVWIKPDSAPQFNGQGPAMGAEMFVSAWCGRGHSKWNGGGRRNVFTYLVNNHDREGSHPTEKPINLMKELVHLFSNENETICDPFMGSGTTGVACVKLGRKFIGIEIEKKWFDLSRKRIQEALDQPDFFIKNTPLLETQQAAE